MVIDFYFFEYDHVIVGTLDYSVKYELTEIFLFHISPLVTDTTLDNITSGYLRKTHTIE